MEGSHAGECGVRGERAVVSWDIQRAEDFLDATVEIGASPPILDIRPDYAGRPQIVRPNAGDLEGERGEPKRTQCLKKRIEAGGGYFPDEFKGNMSNRGIHKGESGIRPGQDGLAFPNLLAYFGWQINSNKNSHHQTTYVSVHYNEYSRSDRQVCPRDPYR